MIIDIDLSITKRGFYLNSNQAVVNYQWLDCKDENKVMANGDLKTYRTPKYVLFTVLIKSNSYIGTSLCLPVTGVGVTENTAF